jgi:hypothetical protein
MTVILDGVMNRQWHDFLFGACNRNAAVLFAWELAAISHYPISWFCHGSSPLCLNSTALNWLSQALSCQFTTPARGNYLAIRLAA